MRFKNLIARIRGTQTIVIATHIVDDVESLCNQIILLKNGRIVCQEKTESLRDAADGFVYSVPWQERGSLTEPFTIMQDETANGQGFLRVLAPNQQPGIQISPTLEDGYMFKVKGYYEIANNQDCLEEESTSPNNSIISTLYCITDYRVLNISSI